MTLQLRKAERSKTKQRINFSAPSGAGKTYSALLLAKGMSSSWEKVALIDTEQGRGDLYSHLGGYNVITLEAPFSPERYIEAMKICEDAGIETIIIDSVTHEWEGTGGCLESNTKLANIKYRGNTWSAWSETTPRHMKFIYAVMQSPCHVITTSRSKVETVMGDDHKVKKVGMKDIQREGYEYEFIVTFNVDRDSHCVIVSKDNTGLFEGKEPFVVTEKTGRMLKEWSDSGKEPIHKMKSVEEIEEEVEKMVTSIAVPPTFNTPTRERSPILKAQIKRVLDKIGSGNETVNSEIAKFDNGNITDKDLISYLKGIN